MLPGRLTTHVLDTAGGCPASGIPIRVTLLNPTAQLLATAVTNADGRCDAPLLESPAFRPGRYELSFLVGAYFRRHHPELPDPPFLDEIVVRFGIQAADRYYHVPLLVSPYSYSTYRGS
jgi:5-hydroxyisourate hydrolase